MEFGVLFCVFRAKMPIFDPFFVVFPFFSEKFSLLMAASISLKKSNRAKVGVYLTQNDRLSLAFVKNL